MSFPPILGEHCYDILPTPFFFLYNKKTYAYTTEYQNKKEHSDNDNNKKSTQKDCSSPPLPTYSSSILRNVLEEKRGIAQKRR
jgi:hypothetical protein